MHFVIILFVSIFLLLLFGIFVYFYYKSKKELDCLKEIIDNIDNPFNELKRKYKICQKYKKVIKIYQQSTNKLLNNKIKEEGNLIQGYESKPELETILNPTKDISKGERNEENITNEYNHYSDNDQNKNCILSKESQRNSNGNLIEELKNEIPSPRRTTTPPLNYKRKLSIL